MPSKDPEKIREKNRRYREKHGDELRAKARELWKSPEGREKRREYMARFIETHPNYYKEYREKHRPECQEPRVKLGPIGGPEDPRHGTTNGYANLKCRCKLCRAAWAESVREYRLRRKGGQA